MKEDLVTSDTTHKHNPYSYPTCSDFQKFEAKLEARFRKSLLPHFGEKRRTRFGFEKWLSIWKMSLQVGQAVSRVQDQKK